MKIGEQVIAQAGLTWQNAVINSGRKIQNLEPGPL